MSVPRNPQTISGPCAITTSRHGSGRFHPSRTRPSHVPHAIDSSPTDHIGTRRAASRISARPGRAAVGPRPTSSPDPTGGPPPGRCLRPPPPPLPSPPPAPPPPARGEAPPGRVRHHRGVPRGLPLGVDVHVHQVGDVLPDRRRDEI